MTLPTNNAISMSQINTELGQSVTAQISLDTAENRGYALHTFRRFIRIRVNNGRRRPRDLTNIRKYSKSGQNYLTLNYPRLIPVLIQAIKEQQAKIEALEAQINNL